MLGDDYTVGEPSGMDNFLDDTGFLQFLYFLDDEILFSGAWRRAFCLTGRALGHTAKWCLITSLGTPDISAGVHANMSEFALRKATSALSYLGGKLAPMVTLAPRAVCLEGHLLRRGLLLRKQLLLLRGGASGGVPHPRQRVTPPRQPCRPLAQRTEHLRPCRG